ELDVHPPEYSELAALTRKEEGLAQLLKEAGFEDIKVNEENIPVRFTSPKDWWDHGRGSTWGDLVFADMPEEARQAFKDKHLAEVKHLFTEEGVSTATPVVFAIARKPQ